MSWARESVAAIRKIILIEERIDGLTEQVKLLADSNRELDRRLLRVEVKFELIEKVATQGPRRALSAKSEG